MRNFTAQLIAAAALSCTAFAQLPRECFYVTEMHGPESLGTDLLSNLPTLMTMYKPGMELKSVTSMQDPDDGNRLTGLQLDLVDREKKSLQLPMVGAQLDEWESQKVYFKAMQPDKISILVDTELGGVCDVVIYQGKTVTSLSQDTSNCMPEEKGIEETWLRLPNDTPLVGFHSKSDGDMINSLGLILVNTKDPICQKPLTEGHFQTYKGNIFEQSEAAEGDITEAERAKANALEAILVYDTIQKARESRSEIQREIDELKAKKQRHSDEPLSSNDLKMMLDGMAQFDMEGNPRTRSALRSIFDKLIYHYEMVDNEMDEDMEYDLPIKLSQLRYVYKTLALKDGVDGSYFNNRDITESATIEDFTELLDELSQHFATKGGDDDDLGLTPLEMKALEDMFDRMQLFYAFDGADDIPFADELWPIYDSLAETFGEASDYTVSEEKADELFKKIQNKESINRTFEGHKVENYDDLKKIQQDQSSKKITELKVELQKFELIENENMDWLQDEYEVQTDDLDDILSTLKQDESRLDRMQKALIDLERREQKKDMEGKLSPRDQKKYDGNVLPPPPHYLKDGNAGTMRKVNTMLEELPNIASAIESEKAKVTEVEQKLDASAESMIFTFMGVLVVAVALGMALGGCCLLACIKHYQNSQQKRLEQAGRMNLRFNDRHVTSIDMPTIPENTNPDEETSKPAKKRQEEAKVEQNALDTEDIQVQEVKSKGGKFTGTVGKLEMQTENDDEEGDFVNVLTSRGLTYDMPPPERRGTVRQAPKKVKEQSEFSVDQ